MPKDYARYPFKAKPSWLEKGWAKRLLIVIFAVLVAGVLGGGVYLSKKISQREVPIDQYISKLKALIYHPTAHRTVKVVSAPTEAVEQGPEVHFDFYTELPQMKVNVAERPEAPGPSINYFLEIGSYESAPIASERRLSLLLAGIEGVNVVKINEAGKPMFHLQEGPYSNRGQALAAQERLKKKGITSVILKART